MSDERTVNDDNHDRGSSDEVPSRVTDDVLDRVAEDGPLAVLVPEPRTEIAIESLRTEGVYDDERAISPSTDGKIALPVTRPPTETQVDDIVRQVDPTYRTTDLDDVLETQGWTEADLENAPGSWAVVGDVVLVTIPPACPDEEAVADALLDLHGGAATVLADEGIDGVGREPQTRHLAGERDTETVHVEHGTHYALDPSEVMFSPGNQAERVRMGDVVETDEQVLDMFAGIGYFTLPMARAGASVTATELNPTAFRYLLENAVANGVADRIDAYNADCRDVAPDVDVDRVVMGYYGTSAADSDPHHSGADTSRSSEEPESRANAGHEFLPVALDALESGGTLHYHEACPENRLPDRPRSRLGSAVADTGRELVDVEQRRVKTHSAGVVHAVLDATVE
ncbi:hypothetical protein C479_10610 [Halovivax asiaticus JCM 14624]|uniref:SAM-dependent methyltransferase TRM5/TYW2-type domain-containing protein n=1 Tax=Halovivax asiaticus JCM 14624 TaxID=1227490 RepID=M0BEE6_9EURY|nr:class I SAM-dependent methyltransferase family protein [Halovivax asiaticus]ELZ09266.1 hypothetical protein C479_10610 [Halovivax asiaticus JCM 14624]